MAQVGLVDDNRQSYCIAVRVLSPQHSSSSLEGLLLIVHVDCMVIQNAKPLPVWLRMDVKDLEQPRPACSQTFAEDVAKSVHSSCLEKLPCIGCSARGSVGLGQVTWWKESGSWRWRTALFLAPKSSFQQSKGEISPLQGLVMNSGSQLATN